MGEKTEKNNHRLKNQTPEARRLRLGDGLTNEIACYNWATQKNCSRFMALGAIHSVLQTNYQHSLGV